MGKIKVGLLLTLVGSTAFQSIEFFYNNANAFIEINDLRFIAILPMLAGSAILAILLVNKYYRKDDAGRRQQYITATMCLILMAIILITAGGRDYMRQEILSSNRIVDKGVIVERYGSSDSPTNIYHFYVNKTKYEGRFSSYDFKRGNTILVYYYPSNPVVNKPAFKVSVQGRE